MRAGFLTVVLWLCVAGALWVLLSPAAWQRRALTRRADRLEVQVRREWRRGVGLERWRDGLETDPSAIEREARKLGYGLPGERSYPGVPTATSARLAAGRAGRPPARNEVSWVSAVGQSVAPVLMLIIGGALAVLFFTDLRVEDPGARPRTDGGGQE